MNNEIDIGKIVPGLSRTIQNDSDSATINRSRKISVNKDPELANDSDASVVYAIGGNWKGMTGEDKAETELKIDTHSSVIETRCSEILHNEYADEKSFISYDPESLIDEVLKLFSDYDIEEKINFIQTLLDRSEMTDEIIRYFKKEGF